MIQTIKNSGSAEHFHQNSPDPDLTGHFDDNSSKLNDPL